jgi:hypothetical protein
MCFMGSIFCSWFDGNVYVFKSIDYYYYYYWFSRTLPRNSEKVSAKKLGIKDLKRGPVYQMSLYHLFN